jgi:hypothetical protein
MNSVEELARELPGFIDELRLAGYTVGIEQYVAAEDLLLALAARGALPDDPRRLVTLLGPIVCKTPTEQEDFRARFRRWISCDEPPPATAAGGLKQELTELEQGLRIWRGGIAAVGVAASVIGVIALCDVLPTLRDAARRPGAAMRPEPRLTETGPGPRPPEDPTAPELGRQAVPPLSSPVPLRPRLPMTLLVLPVPLLLALGAWELWWIYRAHLFLVRRATTDRPDLTRIVVRGGPRPLFRRIGLYRAAQALRRRRPVGTGGLDVAGTVAATASRAGLYRPVPARRHVVPEYLILVDRASYRDHQARWVGELVDRLVEDDLLIARYSFDGDPRACHARPGAGPQTLRDLAARHPGHRLILFTDGSGLIDPVTGTVAAWADQLDYWPERALLTPVARDRWGDREQALARGGVLLLPATEDGLMALADRLSVRAATPLPPPWPSPPFPELVRERPRRWLERRAPGPLVLDELLGQLRRYLGEDGYSWLAACAVYPVLHWDVTLYIGHSLETAQGQKLLDPARLVALVRLPWFRYGAMPDWLRSRLVTDLTPGQDRATRAAIHTLFLTALYGPADGFPLEVARRRSGPLAALIRRVFRSLQRRSPDDSPLRDYVFATFMLGRTPARLAVGLPQTLAMLVRGRGEGRLAADPVGWLRHLPARQRWTILTLAALLLGLIGYVVSPRLGDWLHLGAAAKVNVQPREILGKTTQDIRALEPDVQQGGQVASSRITAKDPITLSRNAYVSAIGQMSILQIQHSLDLYYAENDRYPKDLQEFIDEIIKPNGIRLPQLPAYQEYAYDAENHKLVVLEYPDRREALKQQFQEKVSP